MRRLHLFALIAALALTACGDTDLRSIEQDLEAQAQAQQSLFERLAGIEESLSAFAEDEGGGTEALDALGRRLTEIDSAIDDLSRLIAEETAARGSSVQNLLGDLGSLQTALEQIQSDVNALRQSLQAAQRRIDHLCTRAAQDGAPCPQ